MSQKTRTLGLHQTPVPAVRRKGYLKTGMTSSKRTARLAQKDSQNTKKERNRSNAWKHPGSPSFVLPGCSSCSAVSVYCIPAQVSRRWLPTCVLLHIFDLQGKSILCCEFFDILLPYWALLDHSLTSSAAVRYPSRACFSCVIHFLQASTVFSSSDRYVLGRFSFLSVCLSERSRLILLCVPLVPIRRSYFSGFWPLVPQIFPLSPSMLRQLFVGFSVCVVFLFWLICSCAQELAQVLRSFFACFRSPISVLFRVRFLLALSESSSDTREVPIRCRLPCLWRNFKFYPRYVDLTSCRSLNQI